MQNRMESNIRDKFLVKMIKLQEFTENQGPIGGRIDWNGGVGNAELL